MIKIRVSPSQGRIESGFLPMDVANAISEATSFMPAGSEFMMRSKNPKFRNWDGTKKLYHRGTRTFLPGLLPRVAEQLKRAGLEYKVEESAEMGWNHIAPLPPIQPGWTLRPYQTDVVDAAIGARRCMIRVATGGGKTPIAGHIISILRTPTVFFVHTKDLLYQAIDTFRAMFGEEYVGQIGDGKIEAHAPITICTLQTAARALEVDYEKDSFAEGDESWKDEETDAEGHAHFIRKLLDGAGLLIMDECHRVAAPTAMDVLGAVRNAPYRIGMSASPWRDDGADLALEGVFGQVAITVDASRLIREGFLVRPYIRMVDTPIYRAVKGTKYSTVYTDAVVDNDHRNTRGVQEATRLIGRGTATLILVRHISHGVAVSERLADLGVPFLSGKDDSTHRNQVLRDLRAGSLPGLVATTIADEGLDVKPLGGLVLLGGGKSSTRALQRVGRVLRPHPGKKHATVIDFTDNAKFLIDHSRARQRIYETEDEFVVTDV